MQIGDRVKITKGRSIRETGRVVRICKLTGWVHVTFDSNSEDSMYRDYEEGPFCEQEIKLIGENP